MDTLQATGGLKMISAKTKKAVGKEKSVTATNVPAKGNGQKLFEVTLLDIHYHDGMKCGPGTPNLTIRVTESQKDSLQLWGKI